MIYFICCFATSLIATLFIMRSSTQHGRLSADHDLDGPQKFHARPVPRVGGLGVMAALVAGVGVAQVNGAPVANATPAEGATQVLRVVRLNSLSTGCSSPIPGGSGPF